MTTRHDPPPHFDEARRTIWADAIERLTANGQLFRADPLVLRTYVEAAVSHDQASRLVSQTNVLITRGDRAIENPALAVQRTTARALRDASRHLGLDRNPVNTPTPTTPTTTNPPQPRWCDQHKRYECTRHKRRCGCPSTAEPPGPEGCCHARAVMGTPGCRMHVGKKLADARHDGQVALARLYGHPLDVTPIEGLLDEVRWSAGHVAALRRLLETIEAGSETGTQPGSPGVLWWGTTRLVTGWDGDTERTEAPALHIVLQAYNLERAHFLRACQVAVAAGAQQHMVDQARQIGQTFGRLLDLLLPRLQLEPWQFALLPDVLPDVLRELPASDEETNG